MARFVSARRTDSLEALLQELWTLRPELEGKPSLTIYMSFAALIRECERLTDVPAGGAVSANIAVPLETSTDFEETSPDSKPMSMVPQRLDDEWE